LALKDKYIVFKISKLFSSFENYWTCWQ